MSQAKERPILFSGPMVRAIVDGRKTVTRREIKPRMRSADTQFELHQQPDGSWRPLHTFDESCMDAQGTEHPIVCPYGQPGDRLWVRETWLEDPEDDGTWAYTQYVGCKGSPLSDIPKRFQKPEHCIFRASWEGPDMLWRPSIHMPRWASRILLEITDVRVERLQDIGEQQALAEGIVGVDFRPDDGFPICRGYMVGPDDGSTPLETHASKAFAGLWRSINGTDSWDANPWVWVVEFKRVEQ